MLNATVEQLENAEQYDLQNEQTSLEQIFKEFFKENTRYKSAIQKHFERLKKAIDTRQDKKTLFYNDFIAISDTIRLHKLVDTWNELQKDKDETFGPKNKFSEVMNNLLVNKSFRFDERNQPSFRGQKNKVDITDLSSGEKQLFIMLGSSLVQENAPFVYLADEPELSLHIDWQRKLVSNLKHLNPYAQIIFATHSPDIVAGNQRNVIRMESILEQGKGS
jgi:predicted ATP-binding protein involved in virulence